MIPTYTCPHCQEQISASVDFSGEMPTGMLQLCDCPQARTAWETEHRAAMERKKNASRGGVRSGSIIHVGRTPRPNSKLRYK